MNLIMKLTGLSWIWDVVDGYKTYITAAVAIATGLGGLGQELLPVLNAHNAGALLSLVKGLPSDPSWLLLVGGFGALGLGHKIDKSITSNTKNTAQEASPQ